MKDKQAAELLRAQDNVLILTHRQPDGDTIGCAAALCLALRQMGKTAHVAPNETMHGLFTPYLEGCLAPDGFTPGFVVSVDVAGVGMFPKSTAHYVGSIDLAIDHHASNEGFGRANCLDVTCAACGELLYRILGGLVTITPEIALPLYMAVATDTGCFVYSNTTSETHRVAAALMDTGIPAASVNKRHFRTKSYRRLQMECRIVEGLECHDRGTLVIATVTLDMMSALGATEEDMEDIAAFVGQIDGVSTAITLRELRPGECKLSVRTDRSLNASDVCALLGGGGHPAAAGCTIRGTVDEAKSAILGAVKAVQDG